MLKPTGLFCCLLCVLLFATQCRKAIKCEGDTLTSSETAKTKFYFRGTVNGSYKDWTVTDYLSATNDGWGSSKYYFNGASAADALGNDCVNTFCKYLLEDVVIGEWNGPGPTRNYIAAGFNLGSKTGNRNEIIDQFAPGQKSFGKPRSNISDPVKDGVYVYYIDENGKEWCSHYGPGTQSNSVFTSVEMQSQPNPLIPCLNIWKARFSCTLYDRNEGAIQLKDCEIYCPVLVKK